MVKWYKNLPIKFKLVLSYFIIIAVPSILVIYLARTTMVDMVMRESINQSFVLARQSASALDATLAPLSSLSSALQRNSLVRQMCTGAASAEEKKEIGKDADLVNELWDILKAEVDGSLITDMHLYTDLVPDYLYEDEKLGDFFLPVSEISTSYWHGIFESTNRSSLYCPSFYLTHKENNEFGNLAYAQKLYPTARIADVSPSYLVIYFSQEALEKILVQDASAHKGVSYILNERESMVASSDRSRYATFQLPYDTVRGLSSSESGYKELTLLEGRVYASGYRLGDGDWYLVTIMMADPILERGRAILLNLAMIYFLTLTLALIFGIALSGSITNRISVVNSSMRSARDDLPVPLPPPDSSDEIGELTDSYNHMAREINILMDKEKESADELRKTEVRALQAQINPHFLYNTMEMISWLAQTGKRDEVTEAVRALSRFYKLTLSKKDIYTDLDAEREHVRLYLELQNMRYEGRIHLIEDIPYDIKHVRLPKLTLQPIVENCVLHGILEKEEPEGNILITGWSEEEDVVILVSDDGVGMDEETVEEILSGNTGSKGGTNIAVYNTHRRLQMLYGPEYGLTYRSKQGEGTEVEIRLPIETGKVV